MLYALKEYADQRSLTIKPGFKRKNVRWLLAFNRDGSFIGVHEGREFPICPHLSLPEIKAGGSGCRHFLVDGLDVVALYTNLDKESMDSEVKKKFEKLQAKHNYFISRLSDASKFEPDLAGIVNALANQDLLQHIRSKLAEVKAKFTDLSSFIVVDTEQPVLVERTTWHEWWDNFRESLASDAHKKPMLCLLSGKIVEPEKTHPKLSGLSDVGGSPMGDTIVSFKQPSFRSFGLEWAENCAMSEEMAETYRIALDSLMKENSKRLVGSKVVYWYTGNVDRNEDPMLDLFGDVDFGEAEVKSLDESGQLDSQRHRLQAETRAAKLLEAIRTGDSEAIKLQKERYYVLTISGNSGRVVVRDWMNGQFKDLLENIKAWFSDLAITKYSGEGEARTPSLESIITSLLPERKKNQKYEDWIKPIGPDRVALWQAALNRQRSIPFSSLARVGAKHKDFILSGKLEEAVKNREKNPNQYASIISLLQRRMALIKAYHIRKGELQMTPSLNTELCNPAYLCGRIMALLADIQQAAIPNVGAGVVQRYYAAASATPGLVLGRLVRLSQIGHVPKIENEDLRYWFEKQMAQTWQKLNERPPATLDLEGQTLFAMGYYQQKAQRYQKVEEKEITE